MIKKLSYILAVIAISLLSFSCDDDIQFENGIIGRGETTVSATVSYNPLISSNLDTSGRSSGDALKDLNDIHVFIYRITKTTTAGGTTENSELYQICSGDDLVDLETFNKDTEGSNTDTPYDPSTSNDPESASDPAHSQAEATTARATFKLKDIPNGRYRMYVTANIEIPADAMTRFADENALKEYRVIWNESNIAANDQAFGYLANSNEEWEDFDAPTLTLNHSTVNLYAWLRRAASKVTIAFDGSGLHEGIYIYIKDVRIKDIPSKCKIGADNKATETDLIKDGEIIYYNQNGPITDGTEVSEDYKGWLQINKGNGVRGTTLKKDEAGNIIGHSEYAPALYFYENMQGNYEGQTEYDKIPDESAAGTNIYEPGQPDYKDGIVNGTYIEVEGYYVSTNTGDITHGRIIYRFMLGENTTYNYNAIRNHHYQLTLGFKGFANQPDWHINYYEKEETLFTDPTYYISYMYNQKAIFPIRILGDVKKLEVEIVENNWAPYDPTASETMPVPKDDEDFRWNRAVFENAGHKTTTDVIGYTGGSNEAECQKSVTARGYYYGLQRPYSYSSSTHKLTRLADGYDEKDIQRGAPEYVTPIWAGFLALNVPKDLSATLLTDGYFYCTKMSELRDYFYKESQHYRSIDLSNISKLEKGGSTTDGTDNNVCKITKAQDGSITVHFPMWTRPKSMLGISGFTGNNPYDTYQRRAIVKITATYEKKKITKFMPVFQVRRIVNPKAVWRKWDTTEKDFHVTLVRRENAKSTTPFTPFTSEGEWRAYIKNTPSGDNSFITLKGGTGTETGPNGEAAIKGNTGTPIDFTIHFNGQLNSADDAKCAIVEIEYHGYTCYHSIYVRQGYNNPLDIAGDGVRWSSYSLFGCVNLPPFGTEWDPTGGEDGKGNYIEATLTASPLALGSFFKRGNYNGIRIINNKTYGFNVAPKDGTFQMINGDPMTWKQMEGYPYTDSYNENGVWSNTKIFDENTPQGSFSWGRFKVDFRSGSVHEIRYYRVPSYENYEKLRKESDYGIGVMYADGATTTATVLNDAYGFEDFDNNGEDNRDPGTSGSSESRGMRGMIVYNPNNARQLFFPVGARGVGRRTISGYNNKSYNDFGKLRYAQITGLLTGAQNSFRPIPYNTYANPGALYWVRSPAENELAWDVNYYDLNFIPHGFPLGFTPNYTEGREFNLTHGGDAIPIKLVLDETRPIETVTK